MFKKVLGLVGRIVIIASIALAVVLLLSGENKVALLVPAVGALVGLGLCAHFTLVYWILSTGMLIAGLWIGIKSGFHAAAIWLLVGAGLNVLAILEGSLAAWAASAAQEEQEFQHQAQPGAQVLYQGQPVAGQDYNRQGQ